jgi:hypothetical protein
MSTEKPKKRLVGKIEYLRIMATKWALSWAAVTLLVFGLIMFVNAVGNLVHDAFFSEFRFQPTTAVNLGRFTPTDQNYFLALAVFLGGICLTIMWVGQAMFTKARKIEPVELVTRHNTGHLSEVETLVRGSDRPPTDQQAELLRAAGQGAETPPEQLLRAGQENRPHQIDKKEARAEDGKTTNT